MSSATETTPRRPRLTSRLPLVPIGTRLSRWMLDRGYLAGRTVTVMEFPKSGGTWLAHMLSTMLEWPFLDDTPMPPANNCVLRGHSAPHASSPALVYVVRDPRDTYLSLFHHRIHHWDSNHPYRRAWMARFHRPLPTAEVRSAMPDFLEFEFEFAGRRGSATPLGWGDHVAAFQQVGQLDRTGSKVLTTYEKLRADTATELERIYSALFGADVPRGIAESAALAHRIDLRRQASGHPSIGRSFIRKGTTGGWRETFTQSAGQVLQEYCGAQMAELGYSSSPNWWRELPAR